MKVIRINTPKGQYVLPLIKVAEHRADYYACEVEQEEKGSQAWKDEVDFVMNDDYEGIDWILNQSNPEDWTMIKINDKVKVTDDDYWTSSDDFEIIEHKS